MLYTIAVILLIAWVLGLVGTYTIGAFVHVLLVVALVLIVMGLVTLQHLRTHHAHLPLGASRLPPSPPSGFGGASAPRASQLALRASRLAPRTRMCRR